MTAVPGKRQGDHPPRAATVRAFLELLGLSRRAGALVSGTHAVRAAVQEGSVHRAILAADAAQGQRGKLIPLLDARRIPYYIGFTREELGAATGRSPVSAVGLTNRALAERAGQLLMSITPESR
ncbi:MAG: 50S ribosomal protein L7 [Gemmatimonas sp.]|nr:50S ribosomal protein L7 [Gemmatimonas sp.]